MSRCDIENTSHGLLIVAEEIDITRQAVLEVNATQRGTTRNAARRILLNVSQVVEDLTRDHPLIPAKRHGSCQWVVPAQAGGTTCP
jgi:hypothetical protein